MRAGSLVHLLKLCGQLLGVQVIETRGGNQLVAEASDDEQGIVDAHCETNHGRQHRGLIGDRVREDGGELDAQQADAHANDGGDKRHACGYERAEGNKQHDGRDDEADDLGDHVHLGGAVEGVAAVFHGEVAFVVVAQNIRDRSHLFLRDVGDGICSEFDGDGAGALIRAERG